MANGNGSERVKITLNGVEVQAQKGRLLIDVAEEEGVFVPRFCYHPGMKSVAVCRMCLVHVEGQKKLVPACATPVDEGMVANTVEENAVDAQRGMLEFLLINHPLDCPICDRGGECPLQDQTYAHGPGSTRYVEPKRTYEKALEISDLVVLDRERCVLCWRCVRFADEVAGDQFIQLVDRGAGTQILTFKDDPFDSYFSGNTVQICPVGALTSKPYRFVSRPWDLKTAPSVCGYCAVGCPMTNEARANKLVRCQALPNENVNDFWTCDKGRYGYHYVDSEDRLDSPYLRSGSEFEATSWGEALAALADKLQGDAKVGVVCGGHVTTEDAYAIQKLAKKVIGTRDVDSRIQDAGAPYEVALRFGAVAGSTATLNDLEGAKTIVWAGPDPKEVLPVLFLRLRKAVLELGARLIVVSPRAISLDLFADMVVRCAPGSEADEVAKLTREVSGDGLVACWGPSASGRDETRLVEAIWNMAGPSGKVLVCAPHAGSQGLIDMGVHPALDAGYVAADEPGRDTRAILQAAADGELDVLVVVAADLTNDFPDADLARRALESKAFVVAIELFPTETVQHADVVFPSAAYAERAGTFTNLERRIQRLEPLLAAPGTAIPVWRICQRIASALAQEWGWDNVHDVWTEIRSEVPTHADVDLDGLIQPTPPQSLAYESGFESHATLHTVAGPGGGYPKGHRSGAPFQTGQNWPLSWELRAFEAKQRPGLIPTVGWTEGAEAVTEGEASGAGASQPPEATPEVSSEDGTPSSGTETESMFVLYSSRLIYDSGQMVSRSAALRGLSRKPFVEMNADDVKELGLSDGDDVVVSGAGVDVALPIVVGDIARGAVFVPFDQEGLRANTLMSGIDPVVSLRRPS